MPPILLAVLAFFLSLAWVIPNHTKPWSSFHSDAIVGLVLLLATLWVLIRTRGRLELIGVGLFLLLLALVPWLQYSTGMITSFGTAWINSLYLVGFSLAIFAGWHWEKLTPGECLNFLFLAISCAAVVSVVIQVVQWLQLVTDNLWIVDVDSRFPANLSQPNQLASLLLLAVVGVAWGYAKKALGPVVAILLVLYLLFGVALTDSRTAWLNIVGILVGLFLFWGEGRPKHLSRALLGFGIYFVVLHFSLPVINELLVGKVSASRTVGDAIRLGMWKSLAMAALERPWLGYGWGQTAVAVFAAKDFPFTASVTTHSHNIVLDLVLYNGLILGGLVVAVFAVTFRRFLGSLKQAYFIFPLLAVGLLLVHAMLELPLHYAYFLLPFGMIVGVLGHRSDIKVWLVCPKWIGFGFAIAVGYGLWLTVADCIQIERTYFNVYFGKKGKVIPPEFLPKVNVLPQWRDRLLLDNEIPSDKLSPERLNWMKGVVIATPQSFLVFQLARSLALNGRPDEAREWLESMCKMAPAWVGQELADQWAIGGETHAAYRAVDWKHCPETLAFPESDR